MALLLFACCSVPAEGDTSDGWLQNEARQGKPADLQPQQILTKFGYGGVEAASDRQLASYRRVFGFLDADRDGRHSKQEYIEDGNFMSRRTRQGIFAASDSNHDGFVSEAEYIENRIITDEAKEIFSSMDADGDGRLTAQELIASGRLGDDELATDVFEALDTNGNGELTVPEYLRVWGRWARSASDQATLR